MDRFRARALPGPARPLGSMRPFLGSIADGTHDKECDEKRLVLTPCTRHHGLSKLYRADRDAERKRDITMDGPRGSLRRLYTLLLIISPDIRWEGVRSILEREPLVDSWGKCPPPTPWRHRMRLQR